MRGKLLRVPLAVCARFNLLLHWVFAVEPLGCALPVSHVVQFARAARCSHQLEVCTGRLSICVCVRGRLLLLPVGYRGPMCCCLLLCGRGCTHPVFSVFRLTRARENAAFQCVFSECATGSCNASAPDRVRMRYLSASSVPLRARALALARANPIRAPAARCVAPSLDLALAFLSRFYDLLSSISIEPEFD
jgi:hypothetical protein